MKDRRELLLAVLLAVAGGGLALLAASQTWARGMVTGPVTIPVAAAGRTLAPLVPALGLVAIAAPIVLWAGRRVGRVLAGVVLVLAGLGLAANAVTTGQDPARALREEAGRAVAQQDARPRDVRGSAWPWVATAGGALTAASGALTLARGRRWPAMSARYERSRPAAGAARESARMWDALDRGDDPTA